MKKHACVENLDSDFVCARGLHLDILDLERLACTPAHGSLAFDDLSRSFRHDDDLISLATDGVRGFPLRWPISPHWLRIRLPPPHD